MPDQSSAATEHAIIQEITAPLQTLPDDPVAAVNADFPVALRGYDRMAVDAYVQQTSRLVAELQATRSPEAAVRRALERVGEQISGILQRAHDTAEQITAQSRREAEDRLEQARAEGRDIAAAAEQRVQDLDTDTDRIWIERQRIVDDARDLASQLLALAETAAERFPDAQDPGTPLSSGEYAGEDDLTTPFEDNEDATTRLSDDDVAHYAADEEQLLDEDGVEEDPETDATESDATAESHATAESDATAAFEPVEPEPEGPEPEPDADPGPSQRSDELRQTSSHPVIPPASQAANRRADH